MELKDLKEFEELTKDRKAFCSWCDSVYRSPFFEILIKRLQYDNMKNTFETAQNHEQLRYGQAISHGIDFISRAFLTYSKEFEIINKPKEDFDKSKMVGRL